MPLEMPEVSPLLANRATRSTTDRHQPNEPLAVELMRQHVLSQLSQFRLRFNAGQRIPPLMVAVQGPQGSGKTYLTTRLRDSLAAAPHALSVAVLSIDDLYLPHDGLVALAQANPDNGLLRGRGQPGTHDVPLGSAILHKLKHINDSGSEEVILPRFDKSLHGGEGDRVPEGTAVQPPLDVVIFEGWCTGFYPVSAEELDRRWAAPVPDLGEDFFQARGFRKEDVVDVNSRLKEYVEWWEQFDTFIQVCLLAEYLFIGPAEWSNATDQARDVSSVFTHIQVASAARTPHEVAEWRTRHVGRTGYLVSN